MPCAVILTAFAIEYQAVCKHLRDLREEIHAQGTVYGRGTFTGNGQVWDIGLVEIGMGNPAAAFEAERAIAYFKPSCIFFVGVAGGLKDVKIGDVVVSTKIYGYESGKTDEIFKPRPEIGLPAYSLEQRARAEARKSDWNSRLSVVPEILPRVWLAPIAAGEKVITSKQSEVFQFLRSHYEDAIAVEMEGIGFLEAVRGNRVDAIIIRGISDLIDDKRASDNAGYQEIASRHASAFAFEMLAKLQTVVSGVPAGETTARQQPESDKMLQNNSNNAMGNQAVVKDGGVLYMGEIHIHGSLPTEQNRQTNDGCSSNSIRQKCETDVSDTDSVDALVKAVRSRIYEDIQKLHGTMPLLGVDHWVSLGELFVDVNILEEVSSSRKSELDKLWQDFSQNPSYRGLDRMGLGKGQKRVPGLKVLENGSNVMVVGKPGSGKTIYLQRIVTECNTGKLQSQKIPVLIKLRDFIDDGESFQYSVEHYLTDYWNVSEADTKLIFSQGRALILLDGLDEVTGEKGKQITKQIRRFARTFSKNQLIVTCRTQNQKSRFERFDYVEVADFNKVQVRAFSEHWFHTISGDNSIELCKTKTKEFLDQLFQSENKTIRELAITPILLSLTCAVFNQTGKFYSKRSKLYEEGLELMLEQWNNPEEIERSEIYQNLSANRKIELLSYLAAKKFEQEQYVLFEQKELEEHIANFLGIELKGARSVLEAIECQHGLLIRRSQKIWSFSHLTFQEYLVAKWFCNPINWDKLTDYITYKYWREIFLLSVEISTEPCKLVILLKAKIDMLIAQDVDLQKYLDLIHRECLESVFPIRMPDYENENSEILCDLKVMRALCFDIELQYLHNVKLLFDLMDKIEQIDLFDLVMFRIDHKIPLMHYLAVIFEPRLGHSPMNVLDSVYRYPVASKLNSILHPIKDPSVYADIKKELHGTPYLWWNSNGEKWKQTIKQFMKIHEISLRKDCLKNEQLELMEHYYNANKLLLDCINFTCVISDKVKSEIEETLLLPIAEIKK